ncbi:type II toxin-antitoxin system TacA family antitoxin [Nostoc sp.]|uniref:type II toxin-antitoxin system TacA family antitoxin n=1 Tax=Nostoc sp. TaxID=1180 RepID=UPI002FF7B4E9
MQPPFAESANRNRDITINIRAQQAQRDLIDRAAEALGKNRSDFMLETACREAETVLLDRRLFMLEEEKFHQFMELLDAPPSGNENLRKVLTTKAPWE